MKREGRKERRKVRRKERKKEKTLGREAMNLRSFSFMGGKQIAPCIALTEMSARAWPLLGARPHDEAFHVSVCLWGQ